MSIIRTVNMHLLEIEVVVSLGFLPKLQKDIERHKINKGCNCHYREERRRTVRDLVRAKFLFLGLMFWKLPL